MKQTAIIEANDLTDYACQVRLLPGVSRTFALTIPQLPEPLRSVVTNAYLLCRVADTIEDDVKLTHLQKAEFHEQFRQVLARERQSEIFADELFSQLADSTPIAEKELIQNLPAVIRCLQTFTPKQQSSLCRCVNIMSTGMPHYQREISLAGLKDIEELNRYCYYVAGVVGEMLTELFCDYSEKIAEQRSQLMNLGVAFGQGLQMTNILKDFWDDRSRGVCWLPKEVFINLGIDLQKWTPGTQQQDFNQAMRYLIRLAKDHLRSALEYTLMIPAEEKGIRNFALWAIGLAVLTLRNLYQRPDFSCGADVKVTRRTVKTTIVISNLCRSRETLLKLLFNLLTREIR